MKDIEIIIKRQNDIADPTSVGSAFFMPAPAAWEIAEIAGQACDEAAMTARGKSAPQQQMLSLRSA